MQRRHLIKVALATPVALACGATHAAETFNFVLVHGAFHGGWCWEPVAKILRSRGHRVLTPTFTGLGERAHLMSPSIDMSTFVQDVFAVMETEELNDVILVGHSFGGYVITGVADRMPNRIRRLVYLDAGIGSNGATVFSEVPSAVREVRLKAAVEIGGTRVILPPPAASFGVVDTAQAEWVSRRMTPMPFKSFDSPLILSKAPGEDVEKRYIRCTRPALPQAEPAARYAREQGWRFTELQVPHDVMVVAPEALANLLLEG